MEKQLILLSNDDGVNADGIKSLYDALISRYSILMVAPLEEMSASSHSVTLKKPLYIKKLRDDVYGVSGTPADCIITGLFHILNRKPDYILSGINLGQNLGEDVFYSGTVAAAREGALYGISSVAFSIVVKSSDKVVYYKDAAFIARYITENILPHIGGGVLLNVNIPNLPLDKIRGYKVTNLTTRRYVDVITEEKGYIVIGGRPIWQMEEGSDIVAVKEGYVSVTPLLKDLTHYEEKEKLEAAFKRTH